MHQLSDYGKERVTLLPVIFLLLAIAAACTAVPPPKPTIQKKIETPLRPRPVNHLPPEEMLTPLAVLKPSVATEEKLPFESRVFSLSARNSPLQDVVMGLAKEAGLNLMVDKDVNPLQPVTVEVSNLSLRQTLDLIFEGLDNFYTIDGNILKIKSLETRTFKVEVPHFYTSADSTGEGNAVGATTMMGGFNISTTIKSEGLDLWAQIQEALTPYAEYSKSYTNEYGRILGNELEDQNEINRESLAESESRDDYESKSESGSAMQGAQGQWRDSGSNSTNESKTDNSSNRGRNRKRARRIDTKNTRDNQNRDINETITESNEQTRGLLSPKGRARFDPLSGTIVVTDNPVNLDLVQDYLRRLEEGARRQVIIEARIMEVRLDDRHQYGIDWSYVSDNVNFAMQLAQNVPNTIQLGLIDLDGHDGLLRALATQGDVNVLSSPRLHVLNNQSAVLNVGRSIPYLNWTVQCNTTQGGIATVPICTTVPTVEREQVGVSLGVTPRIGDDGLITMHIVPVIRDLVDFQSFVVRETRFEVPVVDTRGTDTIIQAVDNETVLIGGLIQELHNDAITGLPVLKDVPILGGLFSSQNKRTAKSELVISLTPKIVYQ